MNWAAFPATAAALLTAAAVAPVTAKSALSTFSTASPKVTRKVSVSALVICGCAFVPSWRSMDTTVGAPVSAVTLSSAAALPLPAASRTAPAGTLTTTASMTSAAGVTVTVHTSGSEVAASAAAPLVTSRSSTLKAPSPVVCRPFASVKVTVTSKAPVGVPVSPPARASATSGAALSRM